jgi:hypothetical protein
MEHRAINMSKEELESLKREIIANHQKLKHRSDDDDDNHGCLALLKKLTCSLQCGGSTCSMKETETGSSKSPTPSISSLESDLVSPPKRRKRPAKKQAEDPLGPPAVKKVRRSTKKKELQPEQPQ